MMRAHMRDVVLAAVSFGGCIMLLKPDHTSPSRHRLGMHRPPSASRRTSRFVPRANGSLCTSTNTKS